MIAQHPRERHGWSRVCRVTQCGRFEVTMARLRAVIVGVVGYARVFKRRHEAHAFCDARRPLLLGQILDAFSTYRFFSIVVSAFGDTIEYKAIAI